jgi:hypothetical protein
MDINSRLPLDFDKVALKIKEFKLSMEIQLMDNLHKTCRTRHHIKT